MVLTCARLLSVYHPSHVHGVHTRQPRGLRLDVLATHDHLRDDAVRARPSEVRADVTSARRQWANPVHNHSAVPGFYLVLWGSCYRDSHQSRHMGRCSSAFLLVCTPTLIADHTAAVSVRRVHRVRGPATLSSLRLMFSHQERVRYPLYLGLSDAGKTWMPLVRI